MKIEKFLLLVMISCFVGCASEVARSPVELSINNIDSSKKYIIIKQASVRFDSGYSRTLNEGTQFTAIGVVKQGTVLKPTNTIFTIEGAHIHEAYLVINKDSVVGFYLPVERSFSPLSQPVVLSLQERN